MNHSEPHVCYSKAYKQNYLESNRIKYYIDPYDNKERSDTYITIPASPKEQENKLKC